MAEVATIARPYAEAAFEIADRAGALSAWSAVLAKLAEISGHPEIQSLLGNPRVSPSQLLDVLASLAGELPAAARPLIAAMIENKRLAALPAVQVQFEHLKNERESTVDARIDTAFALEESQLAALVKDLELRFRRKIRPQVNVDRELIGGLRITVGDQVIDGTVRAKLTAMQSGLLSA